MTARDVGGIGKIGSAFIEVGASFVGLGDSFAGDIANSLIAQTAVVGSALENLGQAMFTKFTLPVAAATAANITQFQALDRGIRETLTLFGTAPSILDDTFSTMKDGIRSVAEEVGGLESDIADGLYQTISAGVPRGDAFEFLEVAQMASMADKTADLTTAVSGLTTVVNAFGLASSDAEQIADTMFKTVALGKTTFGELSSDIGRVAPLAANAGIAFEELFAIIGSLTLQGLQTSEAISFLRAGITGLLRPTEELNAIFQGIGFTSAEAAIPVIGLQAAFQAVFDAAGGSTSKLQELIGTSEGVSAALGIVGENADTFERIISGLGDSTGATSRAFEIMEGGVGRSFGRMTEAFDRLGNTFGELASELVVPVVDTIASIVSNLADQFTGLLPIAQNVGEALGFFFQVFDIPVIREFVTLIASVGASMYGLLGVIGAVSLALGTLITKALSLRGIIFVVDKLKLAWRGLNGSMVGISTAFSNLGTTLAKSAIPGTNLLSTAMGGLSRIMGILAANPIFATGFWLAILAAITGLVVLISNLKDNFEEAAEGADIFGKQADLLADSLGLVNQGVQLENAEEGEENINTLEKTMAGLIDTVRAARDELGSLAATDLIEALAVELVWIGNSPEDAIESVQLLANIIGGIELEIDASDITGAKNQMDQFGESILTSLDLLQSGSLGAGQSAGIITTVATQLDELFAIARQSGDFEPFLAAIDEIQTRFGDFSPTAARIRRELEELFTLRSGDFSFGQPDLLFDSETILQQLEDAGVNINPEDFAIEIPTKLKPPGPADAFLVGGAGGISEELLQVPQEQIAAFQATADELRLTVDEVAAMGEDGVETYRNLLSGIDSTFTAVREQVMGAFTAIREELAAQQPLLDIYAGAIKQSFDEWKAGQDQFQEDVAAVTTLRDTLIESNLPQALIDAFDRQPIEKQAWLAGLGQEELNIALQEMADSFNIVDTNANERIMQSMETIMADAQTVLDTKYAEMQNTALESGGTVADNFGARFDAQAKAWEGIAAGYITLLTNQLDVVIPGPTVGAPTFSGGISVEGEPVGNGNSTSIYIQNPTSSDLDLDLAKARAIAETINASNNAS